MAIIECRECGGKVSTEATACPHCGAPTPGPEPAKPAAPRPTAPPEKPAKPQPKHYGCGTTLAVIAVLFVVIHLFTGIGSDVATTSTPVANSQAEKDRSAEILACTQAQRIVTERLVSPSTADFPGCVWGAQHYDIRHNAERTLVSVGGHVDSQNRFGGTVRTTFLVLFDRGADDTLTLKQVAIE